MSVGPQEMLADRMNRWIYVNTTHTHTCACTHAHMHVHTGGPQSVMTPVEVNIGYYRLQLIKIKAVFPFVFLATEQ